MCFCPVGLQQGLHLCGDTCILKETGDAVCAGECFADQLCKLR